MNSPRSRYVTLRDGVTLHAREWTTPQTHQGTPIILIHGLASNSRLWDGAARALCQYGHAVVALDLRGHGLSDKPDHGYDMASVARDVVDVIETLQQEHPDWQLPLVIGQSWGGNIVVEVAAQFHEHIRGAVAVDGGTIELQRMFPKWETCKEVLAPPQLVGTPVDRLEKAIRAMHPDWSDEAIAGAMANMEVREDRTISPWLTRERHFTILRGLWEHSPSQRFAEIQRPVMFTPAARIDDPMKNAKEEMLLIAEQNLDKCRVVWFEPADHDLHAQHPQKFADVVHNAITEGFFS